MTDVVLNSPLSIKDAIDRIVVDDVPLEELRVDVVRHAIHIVVPDGEKDFRKRKELVFVGADKLQVIGAGLLTIEWIDDYELRADGSRFAISFHCAGNGKGLTHLSFEFEMVVILDRMAPGT